MAYFGAGPDGLFQNWKKGPFSMFPIRHPIAAADNRRIRRRAARFLGILLSASLAVSCTLLSGSTGRTAKKETPSIATLRAAALRKAAQASAASAAAKAQAEQAAAMAAQQAASSAAQQATASQSEGPAASHAHSSAGSSGSGGADTQWPDSGSVPSPLAVPNLDGKQVVENENAAVDLSYTSYGFIKVHSKDSASSSRLKVIVSLGGGKYTYDLRHDGGSESYPLQMGNGTYTIGVYRNISGNSYAQILSASAPVSLRSSTVPFLVPSQMVNYISGGRAASLARQQVSGKRNNYARISAVLSYVAEHIRYDKGKAASVRSGYVPDIDAVLSSGSGICFDYAAVSAAMLRSVGYPTKQVTGYVGNGRTDHAWNEVYLPGEGWLKVMAVTLRTADWSRVDVTFVSSSTSPADIENYIGNGANYVKQYTY